jgi:hypothetical protein
MSTRGNTHQSRIDELLKKINVNDTPMKVEESSGVVGKITL